MRPANLQVVDQRRIARTGLQIPGALEGNAGNGVQLTHFVPFKFPQEGAQGGGGLDLEAQDAGGVAGAQYVGVIDAISTGQRRADKR